MRNMRSTHIVLQLILIATTSRCFSAEQRSSTVDSKYLNAVREFADNVLKYGRDTYGPKHTPLFVDGLNIHTHQPVKWISPKGGDPLTATETEEWILSNFASQQTLLRTLDGLSAITGDARYSRAATEAIRYAFDYLRTPSGLFYWGHVTAYDALGDAPRGEMTHESIKLHYPYYELMWKVDPEATRKLIEALWCAHVMDWSNLDFNRIGITTADQEEAWNHEYKGGPTFYKSTHGGGGFFVTASSLIQAGTSLYRLSGQEQPLLWSKRLAKRFVDTRHPATGISNFLYNNLPPTPPLGDDLKEHFSHPYPRVFPRNPFEERRGLYWPEDTEAHDWISLFLVGGMLGETGHDFTQWAVEELTAWGKAAYRRKDNSFIPILTDGTDIAGYVNRASNDYGPRGAVAKPLYANLGFFWAYTLAYCASGDKFMWDMSRDIGIGHSFGDIGGTPEDTPELKTDTTCSDVYGLLGFIELHRKTRRPEFLEMAQCIGNSMVANQFHKGFCVPSKKHIYTRFDCIEPLALLNLVAELRSESGSVPRVWPCCPLFVPAYRYKQEGVDRRLIYTLTESPEPPISLQEAAAIGDISVVRSLLDKGVGVDSWDDSLKKTALQRAAMSGHLDVAELLIAKGAQIDAQEDWPGGTPLDYAAEHGHTEVAALLIAKGANVNAKRGGYPVGDSPLHSAVRAGHRDVVQLLVAKGADVNAKTSQGQTALDIALRRNQKEIVGLLAKVADVPSIHVAAQLGELEKVKAFLERGADVDAKDEKGMTLLLRAISGQHADVAEFLIENKADVNTADQQGYVPLVYALWYEDSNSVRLLLDKGADIKSKDTEMGFSVLHWAILMDSKESTELILAAGADVNAKSNSGETPLDVAAYSASSAIGGLLMAHGAQISSLSAAAYVGDLAKVKAFVADGVDINSKAGMVQSTALHSAVAGGRTEVAEFLVRKGSDVNAQNRAGQTPLHMAAGAGHLDIVQLLLKNGADANAKDSRGQTALDLAQKAEHTDTVDLLRKHGARQ